MLENQKNNKVQQKLKRSQLKILRRRMKIHYNVKKLKIKTIYLLVMKLLNLMKEDWMTKVIMVFIDLSCIIQQKRWKPTEEISKEFSEDYPKNYKLGDNKDYTPIEKTEHKRKKTYVYNCNGNIQKTLPTLLCYIYKQQNLHFKLAIEFSYLLVRVEDAKFSTMVNFIVHYASTNTRPKAFRNPVVVDNKKDVDNIIKTLSKTDLIEEFTKQRPDSKTKFCRFLDVKFHVYEMNTPIGKSNELPYHFKEGSNEKALIKYENYDYYLCFWRCLSYHQAKPEDPRSINKKMKQLFNDYYNKEKDIKIIVVLNL
jgi:hypothetical protein